VDELLARALEGDREALEELLRRLRPLVLRRCSRLLQYPEDAEEAAQEALLRITERLGDYSGRGSFEGWVSVVAANQARSTYRSMRRAFEERRHGEPPERADPARTSVIAGSRIDLLDALEALEQRHPETVEPWELRDLGSHPYAEIAELTGTPVGTVKARIHTARTFLRQRLTVEP
jgi:RNA polymerase sigma-70 factor (ECF subfamily)